MRVNPSEFLVAALHENGIHCRVDQQGIHATLYVLPADATRAREIIAKCEAPAHVAAAFRGGRFSLM